MSMDSIDRLRDLELEHTSEVFHDQGYYILLRMFTTFTFYEIRYVIIFLEQPEIRNMAKVVCEVCEQTYSSDLFNNILAGNIYLLF